MVKFGQVEFSGFPTDANGKIKFAVTQHDHKENGQSVVLAKIVITTCDDESAVIFAVPDKAREMLQGILDELNDAFPVTN
jgi:hypothetical protein